MTNEPSGKIVEIAHARRRFAYRRIHDLLRPSFPGVNHKRVYRLYSAANLAVRKRKKVKRPASDRVPLQVARAVNEVWSMDFVSDSLSTGRRIKCLTAADDFSHECVDIAVDWGISGEYVTRMLDRAALFRGYPLAVRTDNGPEFTGRAFMAWGQAHGVRHILIERGRPMQNGCIESFNGKFRDECLNEKWFQDLQQARSAIKAWRQDYNEVRPHSSCGRVPPAKLEHLRPPPRSTYLATPGFLFMNGTAKGGQVTWRDPAAVAYWARDVPMDRETVVYCVYGHEVGRVTALRLRARGINARFLRGGIDAWQAAGQPVDPKGLRREGGRR